jgi:hypothetical protein
MVMTQQYLAGELSLMLAQIQAGVASPALAGALGRLRQEAETLPVVALPGVVARTLPLIDVVCWDSVSRGDTTAFRRQAEASAELYEFALSARLLTEE